MYILNWCYTKAVKGMKPQQAYSSKNSSCSYFKVPGCECFAHVLDAQSTKLDSKSKKCIFLGYRVESKGYRLYDYESKKIIVNCDVVLCKQPHAMEDKVKSLTKMTKKQHYKYNHQNGPVDWAWICIIRGPQGIRPFPKWVKSLLDGKEPPTTLEPPTNLCCSNWIEE